MSQNDTWIEQLFSLFALHTAAVRERTITMPITWLYFDAICRNLFPTTQWET